MTTTVRNAPAPDAGAHVVADQSAVADFLADPASHGPGIDAVERFDTHGAMVFLAGARAYKIKRAVAFPYMDFSTLDRRRAACEAEVALNRRTAPELYLGTEPITRDADGALRIGGTGEVVEWVVVMQRFDQAGLFDRLAAAGRLTPALMQRLTDAVLRFHEAAERLDPAQALGGGADGQRAVAEESLAELAERPDLFPAAEVEGLGALFHGWLDRTAALLDDRQAEGFVRRCHGDLHLRNICLVEDEPTLFDCIEFNEAFAAIDVLYDLAFLLMDLSTGSCGRSPTWSSTATCSAARGWRGWPPCPASWPTAPWCGPRSRPAPRPARARRPPGRPWRQRPGATSRRPGATWSRRQPGCLRSAAFPAAARRPWPDCWRPGSAPRRGALHLRSDVIRKALWGVDELSPLPKAAYEPGFGERVYAEICQRAREALAAGPGGHRRRGLRQAGGAAGHHGRGPRPGPALRRPLAAGPAGDPRCARDRAPRRRLRRRRRSRRAPVDL